MIGVCLYVIAGYGNFTFTMDFYESSSFATPYSDYPIQVALNDYVHVQYAVDSSADLVIMAENCRATKGPSYYSWPQYQIIQNGYVQERQYGFLCYDMNLLD